MESTLVSLSQGASLEVTMVPLGREVAGGHHHGASLAGLPTSSRLELANVQARTGACAGANIKDVPRAATMLGRKWRSKGGYKLTTHLALSLLEFCITFVRAYCACLTRWSREFSWDVGGVFSTRPPQGCDNRRHLIGTLWSQVIACLAPAVRSYIFSLTVRSIRA